MGSPAPPTLPAPPAVEEKAATTVEEVKASAPVEA